MYNRHPVVDMKQSQYTSYPVGGMKKIKKLVLDETVFNELNPEEKHLIVDPSTYITFFSNVLIDALNKSAMRGVQCIPFEEYTSG